MLQVMHPRSYKENTMKALEQFNFFQTLENTPNIAIVFFSSQACSSCRYWEQLLAKYQETKPAINLFKVDAEQDPGLVEEFSVFHLPALFLYIDGVFHSEIQCEANLNDLTNAIDKLAAEPHQEMP